MQTSVRIITATVLAGVLLLTAGCQEWVTGQRKESVTPAEWASLQLQIGVLESQVKDIHERLEALQQRPSNQRKPDTEPALLAATDTGFSVARTRLGPVTVSVDNAEKYLDGYKLKIQLGNITAAQLSGVHIRVTWGLGEKTKQIEVLKALAPGSFTPVVILLFPRRSIRP